LNVTVRTYCTNDPVLLCRLFLSLGRDRIGDSTLTLEEHMAAAGIARYRENGLERSTRTRNKQHLDLHIIPFLAPRSSAS
jgi:hypothetical protein